VWIGLALVLMARKGEAANAPLDVLLELPTCAELPFDSERLSELLDVELRASGVGRLSAGAATSEPSETPAPAVRVSVSVDCRIEADRLELWLYDASSASDHSVVTLADVTPELRPRTIAIAIVELLRASQKTRFARNTVAPSGESPPTQESPQAALLRGLPPGADRTLPPRKPPDATPIGLEGTAMASTFPSSDTALFGGSGGFALQIGLARASVGTHALFGRATPATGSVNVGWAGGYVGMGVQSRGALPVLIEPRIYAGYAWASGTPSRDDVEGHDASGFVIAGVVAGGVRGVILRDWEALADVEVGHMARGLVFLSDEDEVAGLSRVVVNARIGLAFRL
jgi:hypothetical protein